jgi:hypothetical protein
VREDEGADQIGVPLEPAAPIVLVRRILFGGTLTFVSEMTAVDAAANSPQDAMVSRIVTSNAPDDCTFDAALCYSCARDQNTK